MSKEKKFLRGSERAAIWETHAQALQESFRLLLNDYVNELCKCWTRQIVQAAQVKTGYGILWTDHEPGS